ncbi:MAG TPA: hypothetical protein VEI97_08855, partial [bacterium]|nr:hypothetical protein [bacterium]
AQPPADNAPLSDHVRYLVTQSESGFSAITVSDGSRLRATYALPGRIPREERLRLTQVMRQGSGDQMLVAYSSPMYDVTGTVDSLLNRLHGQVSHGVPGWLPMRGLDGEMTWSECGQEVRRGATISLKVVPRQGGQRVSLVLMDEPGSCPVGMAPYTAAALARPAGAPAPTSPFATQLTYLVTQAQTRFQALRGIAQGPGTWIPRFSIRGDLHPEFGNFANKIVERPAQTRYTAAMALGPLEAVLSTRDRYRALISAALPSWGMAEDPDFGSEGLRWSECPRDPYSGRVVALEWQSDVEGTRILNLHVIAYARTSACAPSPSAGGGPARPAPAGPQTGPAQPSPATPASPAIAGTWSWTVRCSDGGVWTGRLKIETGSGGSLSGAFQNTNPSDIGTIQGKVADDRIEFQRTFQWNGQTWLQTWSGTIRNGHIEGIARDRVYLDCPFTAERASGE